MIVFIPRSGDGCKAGDYDAEWLPRRCPTCHQDEIIGHGRRRRQAHDGSHDWILVRRGLCKVCGGALTVLPGWCVPGAPYSLQPRRQALAPICQGASLQQAAPHCRDPNRLPDASTIRRWVCRRIESLQSWMSPTMMDPGSGDTQPQISLLDYLAQHGWKIVRDSGREEVAGLCPLHRESQPSFYVNRRKQVFYCHGCGRGGGLARLIRWLEHTPAPSDPLALGGQILEETYRFYRRQFARNEVARDYLAARGIHDPVVIGRMRIGYAPGAQIGRISHRGNAEGAIWKIPAGTR